jgi:hypothetical protein
MKFKALSVLNFVAVIETRQPIANSSSNGLVRYEAIWDPIFTPEAERAKPHIPSADMIGTKYLRFPNSKHSAMAI